MLGAKKLLVEELAVYVADWITCAVDRPSRSRSIFHSYQGPFDTCCHALWRLNVAFPTDANGADLGEPPYRAFEGLPSGHFTFLNEIEIRRRMSALSHFDAVQFNGLLEAFVDCIGHGDEDVHLTRNWFPLDALPADLWRALSLCGFTEQSTMEYRWSDHFMEIVFQFYPGLQITN